jgi:hypothetical protein
MFGSPVLGDHNTDILVLCTILVYKNIPILYSSIVKLVIFGSIVYINNTRTILEYDIGIN